MLKFDRPRESGYRLYWINRAGQIDAMARLSGAMGDDDAIERAANLADGDHVELWFGLRLVARLVATDVSETVH